MSHSQESPHAAGLGQTVNLMGWRNHAQNSGRTHGNSQFPASTCGPCSTVPTISAKQSSSIGAHGIGRSPRSHCRHVCKPARQSAAMSGWVSAASARRALSVSDWPARVEKGPFGPARLGWFGMSGECFAGVERDDFRVLILGVGVHIYGPAGVVEQAIGARFCVGHGAVPVGFSERFHVALNANNFRVFACHDDLLSDGAVAPFDLDGLDGAVGGVGANHDGFAFAISHQDLDFPIQKLRVLFDGNNAALSDHCSRLTKVLAGDAIPDAGADVVADCCDLFDVHGVSSAPVIPRRGGQRCAVHVVNVSQRDTSVKRYLQRFETVTSWGVA